jgi:uncharacterized membrane protein
VVASWKLFLVVAPLVMLIDLVWLGLIMKHFYQAEIGELARREAGVLTPRWPAAILVYLLIPAGLVIFARPAMGPDASLAKAFFWGALYGLVVYGVYDLTNRAILDKWPLRLTIADIAWGCVLCGSGGLILRLAEKWLGR